MRRGIYFALTTAVISGFSIFANKIFITQTDPLAFTAIRNLMVAVFLSVFLVATKKQGRLTRITQKDWLKLTFIGAVGGGVAFALFFTGLTKIGAVQGNLIHKTLFLWVALLAYPLLGERLHKLQILGYLFIIYATFVIGGGFSFVINRGVLMVFAATILWALENVVAKIALRRVPPEVVGWARIILGLPVLLGIVIFTGKGNALISGPTWSVWPLLTSSLFLTGYVITWYRALSSAPATVVTSILVISPIITNLLNAIFINHNLPQQQALTFVLLAAGVALVIARITSLRIRKLSL